MELEENPSKVDLESTQMKDKMFGIGSGFSIVNI